MTAGTGISINIANTTNTAAAMSITRLTIASDIVQISIIATDFHRTGTDKKTATAV